MRKLVIGGAIATVILLAGCSNTPKSVKADQKATNIQLDRYQRNQPIPQSDWSQYRQTVIDVEMAQIHGVATTSFFFNQGVQQPFQSCPSIGFPVATTSQITNPEQVVAAPNTSSATVHQQEPNGVYTGDSLGTYVTCVAPGGKKYIDYWEGFVYTVGGPAHWDKNAGQIASDGAPTVTTTTK